MESDWPAKIAKKKEHATSQPVIFRCIMQPPICLIIHTHNTVKCHQPKYSHALQPFEINELLPCSRTILGSSLSKQSCLCISKASPTEPKLQALEPAVKSREMWG